MTKIDFMLKKLANIEMYEIDCLSAYLFCSMCNKKIVHNSNYHYFYEA